VTTGRSTYQTDEITFTEVAFAMAAQLIERCEKCDPRIAVNPHRPDWMDSVGARMARYMDMGAEEHRDSLLATATFLRGYIEFALERQPPRYVLRDGQRQLIAEALRAFQDWKTRYIEAEKDAMGQGPYWGDSTPFNQSDWTRRNEPFLRPVTGS
jgi:hypothetical protein